MKAKLKQLGTWLMSPIGSYRVSLGAAILFLFLVLISSERNFSFYSNMFCLTIWINNLRIASKLLGFKEGAEVMTDEVIKLLDKRITTARQNREELISKLN